MTFVNIKRMGTTNKHIDKLLTYEKIEVDPKVMRIFERYEEISDILERTYTAMGRNRAIQVSNQSSSEVKLNLNGVASTI